MPSPAVQVRQVMGEMGADLDRWITDEEIAAAPSLAELAQMGADDPGAPEADPEWAQERRTSRAAVEGFLEKLRKEKERFGAEAVAAKYTELAQDAAREAARESQRAGAKKARGGAGGVRRRAGMASNLKADDEDLFWWLDLPIVYVCVQSSTVWW